MRVDFSKNDYFTTDPAYQWDLNQTIEIINSGMDVAPVIHFANREMDDAILVQSEMDEHGVITCPIPNILLKDKYNIIAWLSNMSDQRSTTEHKIEIPVFERVMPKDYYYTNNVPILTYEAIEADIQTYFNRAKRYTDEAVYDLENQIGQVQSEVDAVEEDVEDIQYKMPFRFGIDIDGNYGYIPDGDDDVIPFAQNGILEVQSTTTNKSITVKSKGKAHCDLTVIKNSGAAYSYTLTILKNGETVKTEIYNGDGGEYKLMYDVDVEENDVLTFNSSETGNLNIYATVYVSGAGINPSGTGLPVWNSVLARMDNMENSFVVPTVADKTDDTVIYFDPDNEELDIAEMSDLDKLSESIDEITEQTKNLIVGVIEGAYVHSSGQIRANASFDLYIANVKEGKYYISNNTNTPSCAYFENYPSIGDTSTRKNLRTTPAPFDGYVVVQADADYVNMQIEEGTEPTDYVPPKTAIDYTARDGLKNFVPQVWKTKKWVVIGDSLTDTNNTTTTMRYFDYIAEETGIEIHNMGNGGSGYKKKEDGNKAFYQRITSCPTDADVVTIFGSGNDKEYNSVETFGTALDMWDESLGAANTLGACINHTIDVLYSVFPTVHLGIVSPCPWKNYNPQNHDNFMARYTELLRQICENRSIPFLDLYHTSNLRPWDDAFRTIVYDKDTGALDGNPSGTHPNEIGHKLLAGRFRVFVESLI